MLELIYIWGWREGETDQEAQLYAYGWKLDSRW